MALTGATLRRRLPEHGRHDRRVMGAIWYDLPPFWSVGADRRWSKMLRRWWEELTMGDLEDFWLSGPVRSCWRLRVRRIGKNRTDEQWRLMGAVGGITVVGEVVEGWRAVRRDRGERLGRVDLLFGLVRDGEGMLSSHRHGCSLVLQVAWSRFARKVHRRGPI